MLYVFNENPEAYEVIVIVIYMGNGNKEYHRDSLPLYD